MYWALMALELLSASDKIQSEAAVEFVRQCQNEDGGFGGKPGSDSHLLQTLSAVQILALIGRVDAVDGEKVALYIKSLQQPDGSFMGDRWGEVDTKFTYCAVCALDLLGLSGQVDMGKAKTFIMSCLNFDQGFGNVPLVFCCVAALKIMGALGEIDCDSLSVWLSQRQLESGGLNGRPEKKEDVCYSWWVLSALSAMGRVDWIDSEKLTQFILLCQDFSSGGIADRPGDMPDVFHTFFGLAGLSLMRKFDLKEIDPIYALPRQVVENIKS